MNLNSLSQKITKPIAVRHRNPMIYVERSKVHVKDNNVVATNKNGCTALAVASTACVLLGPGTSITDEAVKIIARRDCTLLWSGGGGFPIHCISGNYKIPKNFLLQAKIMNDPVDRLNKAKAMLKKRNAFLPASITPVDAIVVDACTSVQDIMLVEARWAKAFYKNTCTVAGVSLARDKMKLTNFFCYGLVTPVLISMGFNPNLGIMHGQNRGGGMVFDIADWIKPVLSVQLGVESILSNWDNNKLKHEIIERYKNASFARRIADGISDIYGLGD